MELAKSFEPQDIEGRWYPLWESRGYFKAGFDPKRQSFSIQLPPPNVTGTLHMGHAFQQTLFNTLLWIIVVPALVVVSPSAATERPSR